MSKNTTVQVPKNKTKKVSEIKSNKQLDKEIEKRIAQSPQ